MEALRKTARFQTEDGGGVRGGIRPQGQERNLQQQRRAREDGAKVVKRNALVQYEVRRLDQSGDADERR